MYHRVPWVMRALCYIDCLPFITHFDSQTRRRARMKNIPLHERLKWNRNENEKTFIRDETT